MDAGYLPTLLEENWFDDCSHSCGYTMAKATASRFAPAAHFTFILVPPHLKPTSSIISTFVGASATALAMPLVLSEASVRFWFTKRAVQKPLRSLSSDILTHIVETCLCN